jgi:hypothetical protein
MALKRYIGPYESVRLMVAGEEIGIVNKGDSVVIPDEIADSVEWSDELWADGPLVPVKTARASKIDDGKEGNV